MCLRFTSFSHTFCFCSILRHGRFPDSSSEDFCRTGIYRCMNVDTVNLDQRISIAGLSSFATTPSTCVGSKRGYLPTQCFPGGNPLSTTKNRKCWKTVSSEWLTLLNEESYHMLSIVLSFLQHRISVCHSMKTRVWNHRGYL